MLRLIHQVAVFTGVLAAYGCMGSGGSDTSPLTQPDLLTSSSDAGATGQDLQTTANPDQKEAVVQPAAYERVTLVGNILDLTYVPVKGGGAVVARGSGGLIDGTGQFVLRGVAIAPNETSIQISIYNPTIYYSPRDPNNGPTGYYGLNVEAKLRPGSGTIRGFELIFVPTNIVKQPEDPPAYIEQIDVYDAEDPYVGRDPNDPKLGRVLEAGTTVLYYDGRAATRQFQDPPYGTGQAPCKSAAGALALCGVEVFVGGVPAPIYEIRTGVIKMQLPRELTTARRLMVTGVLDGIPRTHSFINIK